MAGNRYTGTINAVGFEQLIDIPSSTISPPPNVPITLTAFPLNPGFDLILTAEANVVGFPSGIPQDFGGFGVPEQITFLPGFPAGEGVRTRIRSFAGTGPFLLEVSAENPNDFSFNAEPQGIITTPRSLNGFVGRSDPEDWYQFVTPPGAGPFTFRLSNLVDNADLRVYRSDGFSLLGQGLNPGTANEEFQLPLEPNQTYFIQVSNLATGSNLVDGGATSTPYTLEIIPGSGLGTTVSIAAFGNPSEIGPTPGTFQISRTGDLTNPLAVNFTVGGTATFGADYNQVGATFNIPNGPAVIPAGQSSVNITINPINDGIPELDETIDIGLQAAMGYTVGPQSSASLTILDSSSPQPVGERVSRYWDTTALSHFFTADPGEQQTTNINPRFNNEGFEFRSEGPATLQRFVNSRGGFFYSSNPGEIGFVQTLQEWQASPTGVPIRVFQNPEPGTLPVFRAYNLISDGHFYTIDPNQAAFADSLPNFRLEGISFYAKPNI